MVNMSKRVGLPATLEQLAEECAELSHASLKLSRIMRNESPTPVTEEEAVEHLLEEVTDVSLMIDQVRCADFVGPYLRTYMAALYNEKLRRLERRLEAGDD